MIKTYQIYKNHWLIRSNQVKLEMTLFWLVSLMSNMPNFQNDLTISNQNWIDSIWSCQTSVKPFKNWFRYDHVIKFWYFIWLRYWPGLTSCKFNMRDSNEQFWAKIFLLYFVFKLDGICWNIMWTNWRAMKLAKTLVKWRLS